MPLTEDLPRLIAIKNASVRAESAFLLKNIAFTLRKGEHTAVIGPNGAGKTTLLNLIRAEIRPSAPLEGEPPASVMLFGQSGYSRADIAAKCGFISDGLYYDFRSRVPSITARDVVHSGAQDRIGFPSPEDVTEKQARRADALMTAFRLNTLGNTPLARMSAGEARKCFAARALIKAPRLLLLDEAAAGLDAAAKASFYATVRRAAAHCTIIQVTHTPEELIPEIRRVVMLKQGRVIAAGDPAALMTSQRLTDLFGVHTSVYRNAAGMFCAAD